jgi:uncharacterized protein YdhG (YjbR/CyaY superfamily)
MKEIDAYIAQFESSIQERLQAIRLLVEKRVPKAEAKISYGMPAYKFQKITLYFGAYKDHIGIYPIYRASSLQAELEAYRSPNVKDGLRFKHSHPLPLDLIIRIIEEKWSLSGTEPSN